jgi:hypothetical protein
MSLTKVQVKCGLAIVAMRHWSQGPLQSPTQNVKKGPFGGILMPFEFFCIVAEVF